MTEQHKFYVRLPNQTARRAAAKWMRNLEDDAVDEAGVPIVVDDFDFDGRTRDNIYWAAKMMGDKGRLRFPEGHPQAGGLIAGHFLMMAWQGGLDTIPPRLKDYILTDAQIASVFPNGPPEMMG